MGIDVLTNRYNNERTGANLNETVLNQSNVNPTASERYSRAALMARSMPSR